MISGCSSFAVLTKLGRQWSINTSLVITLFFGLHIRALVIQQSLRRDTPHSSSLLSSNLPLSPTNALPCSSSCRPGASPTISIFFLPLPDTGILGEMQVLYNPHSPHLGSVGKGDLLIRSDAGKNPFIVSFPSDSLSSSSCRSVPPVRCLDQSGR